MLMKYFTSRATEMLNFHIIIRYRQRRAMDSEATDVGRIESCLETGWLSSSLTVSSKHTHTDTRTQREINIIERGKRALSTEQWAVRTSCCRVATVAPPIGLLAWVIELQIKAHKLYRSADISPGHRRPLLSCSIEPTTPGRQLPQLRLRLRFRLRLRCRVSFM